MALVDQVKIRAGSNEIKDYLDLNLQQNIFGHHSLEIVCLRKHVSELPDGKILDKSVDSLLGKKISLTIAVNKADKVEFEGIITELRASKMNDAQSDTIVLEADSIDIVLDDGEDCNSFEEKTLKAIVEELLKEHKISKYKVNPEKAKTALPYTVQYKESAFAFLTRIAAKHGEWFYYNGSEIIFGKRIATKVELEFGTELFNFDYSLKLEDLKFQYLWYDYLQKDKKTQEKVEKLGVLRGSSDDQKISKLSANAKTAFDKSEKVYSHQTYCLYNALATGSEKKKLNTILKTMKSALASGLISCSGSSDNGKLKLGGEIKIVDNYDAKGKKKKSALNHGEYIITSLSHSCDRNGNYQNHFTAVPIEIEVPPYSSPHAIPFCETQSAIVMDNEDPEKLGRVRVSFIWQAAHKEKVYSPWIRVVMPFSGDCYDGDDKSHGFLFVPENGDEVLVGFEGGNAEKPYVIGSLYNSKQAPNKGLVKSNNDIKAIRTRSGHTIEFNDKDGNEELKIYDHNKENYVITLSSHDKSIKIESSGDLELKAELDMNIEAGGKINIKAAEDIGIEGGTDVNINADMDISQKANDITIEGLDIALESTAQMELKASMGMNIDGGLKLEQKAAIIKIN